MSLHAAGTVYSLKHIVVMRECQGGLELGCSRDPCSASRTLFDEHAPARGQREGLDLKGRILLLSRIEWGSLKRLMGTT